MNTEKEIIEEETEKVDLEKTTDDNLTNETDIKAEKNKMEDANQEKNDESQTTPPPVEEETIEQKYNNLNDKYMRLSAEFDNYRKRTLKERMELMKSAGEDILKNFLPVIDNLERAKKSADIATEVEGLKEGLNLIFKNLSDFLSQRGIKEIDAMSKDFDTDLHEALTKIPASSEELKGKVVDVIERGYTLNGKVIRFAKVVVGE